MRFLREFLAVMMVFFLSVTALAQESRVTLIEEWEKVRIDPELLEKARLDPDEIQRVIIVFHKKPVGYRRFIESLNGKMLHDYDIIEGIAISLPGRYVERLKELKNVVSVQEDRMMQAFLTESVPLINADDVWVEGINGSGKTVCVVDTGVDYTHPALTGKIVAQKCYCSVNPPGPATGCCPNGQTEDDDAMDDNGHGTHVSGIIASQNDTYRGVAPGASLMVVKVLDSTGSGYESDVIKGINWCSNQSVDVISISLGGGLFSSYCDSEADAQAVNNAVDKGVVVSVASGNDASTTQISAPACASKATSVGDVYDANVGGITWTACTDPTTAPDKIVCHCNRNEILDLLAPGALITSTVLNSGFDTYGGTSMAAPHVAGTAALLLEAKPTLTPAEVEASLRSTGKSIYDSGSDLTFPRIDVLAAVTLPPMGHLEPYLIDPVTDKQVTQYEFFNFSSGVRCVGGECENVSATLDPTYEISYDDGSAETHLRYSRFAGGGLAVRFTPSSYPIAVKTARFYVYDTKSFELHVWDDDGPGGAPGSDLITPLQASPSSAGWFDIDLSSYDTNIDSGDFYIGWIEPNNGNYLGYDENIPYDGRSWVYDEASWSLVSTYGYPGDLMIRSVVEIGKGPISTTIGDTPFYTTSDNPQTCLNMKDGDTCNQTWQVNATGDLDTSYDFFTIYDSITYAPYIDSNQTQKINITIVSIPGKYTSITLLGYPVDFGNWDPSLNDIPAPKEYTIRIDPETNVNTDIYQKGDDYTSTEGYVLGIGNMTWNRINSTSTYTSITKTYSSVEANVTPDMNITMYYWISIPSAHRAGDYNTTIYVKAVETGSSP